MAVKSVQDCGPERRRVARGKRMRKRMAPCLLAATPRLADPMFRKSVVLLFQHDAEGAIGLVINKRTEFDLKSLLTEAGVESGASGLENVSVHVGGPVSPETGWVLFDGCGPDHTRYAEIAADSFQIDGDLMASGSSDVFDVFARDGFPGRAIFCLGYAGWGPGQLDDELQDNDWLPLPLDRELMFDVNPTERWLAIFHRSGIDPNLWALEPGEG